MHYCLHVFLVFVAFYCCIFSIISQFSEAGTKDDGGDWDVPDT